MKLTNMMGLTALYFLLASIGLVSCQTVNIVSEEAEEDKANESIERCAAEFDEGGGLDYCKDGRFSDCLCRNQRYFDSFVCCVRRYMGDLDRMTWVDRDGLKCRVGNNPDSIITGSCPPLVPSSTGSDPTATTATEPSTSPPATTTSSRPSMTTSSRSTQSKQTSTQTAEENEEESSQSEATPGSGDGDSDARAIGLGVGLGLGIPLAFGVLGYIVFLFWRAQRADKKDASESSEQQGSQQPDGSHTMASVTDRWHSPSNLAAVPSELSDKRLSELIVSRPSERESVQGRYELGPNMAPISELPANERKTDGKLSESQE